ncbi:MAG: aminodeoxychorismate lyase [Gammaproteobacteria bacterium]|jgi:UPF0755 protein|nr:aminodeoxychorismate lyase [Gammaproteobacteria bacterium]
MLNAYREVLRRAQIIAISVCVFGFLIFVGTFLAFLRTPLVDEDAKPVRFIFPMGSSIVHLSNQLHALDLIHYPRGYVLLLGTIMRASDHLHAGEYEIAPGETPIVLLQDMVAGRVIWRDFLFVEGWTLKQLRDALDNNIYLEHKTKGLTEAQLAKLLKIPSKNLEGLFFPDTYRFTGGIPDTLILRQASEAMQKHLNNAWVSRESGLPYKSSYEALIVASLVEKEAALPSDRPRIAGVILKRLSLGMPLQIDASVIYGLKDAYDGKLKISQLKIPSPYNTYLEKGLPPTPIAMPGLASINAAMHPIISKDLFYVADGHGGHVFSATLSGQNRAVAQYRKVEKHHKAKSTPHA